MSSQTAAAPAANPFAALFGRVKRIDQQELVAVATTLSGQDPAATQGAAAGIQAASGTAGAANSLAGAQAQQQAQAAAAQQQAQAAAAQQQASAAAQQLQRQQQAQAVQAQQQAALAAQASQAAAAQTTAAANSGVVAVPTSATAPRTTQDYWTKHIAQFAGKYLPDGPAMRPNCGPASVTMALRMIGLDIPGFNGQNSEAVLDKARIIATGKNDITVGTTDAELERLITASGAKWSETTSFPEVTNWVKQGIPVVLSGNPAYGWNSRYTPDQVYPFNGGHWVTVSGYDQATGNYIVNDPLSQIGPIYVSEAELKNYNQAHGNLGIAVFRG